MRVIFVDGINGVGKSTAIQMLSDYLLSTGASVKVFDIIKSSDLGAAVQSTIKKDVSAYTRIAAVAASTTEALMEQIPALLDTYDYVIVDRSVASYYVYQYREFNSYVGSINDSNEVNGNYASFALAAFIAMLSATKQIDHAYLYLALSPNKAYERASARDKRHVFADADITKYKERSSYYDDFYRFYAVDGKSYKIDMSKTPDNVLKDIVKSLGLVYK